MSVWPPRLKSSIAERLPLNTLLASPTFATWREGATLDIAAWLTPQDDPRTPIIIVSVGMAAVMFTGANRNFFGVFIFLKTMLNVSLVVPQYQPRTPPRWLSSLMDRVPSAKHKGTNFAEFWKQTDDQEAARVARNEKPMERHAANA